MTLKKKKLKKPKQFVLSEISAGGIIFRIADNGAKEILLVKDSYDRWAISKGKLEKGETQEQAALRELTEETGLQNITNKGKLGDLRFFYRFRGKLISKKISVFLIQFTGTEKIKYQKREIKGAKWMKPEEALKKIAYENTKGLLEKAISRLPHYGL